MLNFGTSMLPENKPDKRATDAIVAERVDGLTLRNVEVEWDDHSPEPGWRSALVLRAIDELRLEGIRGRAGRAGAPAIQKTDVKESNP